MHAVGAFEAKTHLSRLLEEVCRTGEPIVVQKRGKNMAVLEPYSKRENNTRSQRARNVLAAFREIREELPAAKKPAETLKELIAEGRR